MTSVEELSYGLHHDSCNAEVLPARTKRPSKQTRSREQPKKKFVSKKEQKRLDKLKDQRHKRTVRKGLLEGLKQLEVPASELSQYESIRGLSKKRKKPEKRFEPQIQLDEESSESEEEAAPAKSVKLMPSVERQPAPAQILSKPIVESISKKPQVEEAIVVIRPTLSNRLPATVTHEPTVFVPVARLDEIDEFRSKLPIITEEAAVIEAVRENQAVIICGETGSGKTTQVPQFLYEAGFTANGHLIGITEPRRMAAISMAKRVAVELNVSEDVCSYQIRFEGNVTDRTLIKFMTDGVLLRELKEDFLLLKYSVIVVDEAHERSMYSDILIGLLSRIGPLRLKRNLPTLKLVIMSATLRIDDFRQTKLFKQLPPVIHIPTRQYPVTVYFNKVTPTDFIEAAYKKVCQIHKLLPEGGILVFVPGQQDVWQLVQWLRQRFPFGSERSRAEEEEEEEQTVSSKRTKKSSKKTKLREKIANLDLSDYKVESSEAPDLNECGAMESLSDEHIFNDEVIGSGDKDESAGPLHVLPLYSMLPTSQQQQVFAAPPIGSRLCIVATNVAETSLTIPNVKYVVDTGKEKSREYDCVTGVSRFVVQWVSKASANQRSGRAGRTGPGFCYRLYSSAVFNFDFPEFSVAEIVLKPADELVLQMKNMNITHVDKFPFPSAPDTESIRNAENRLLKLGALEVSKTVATGGKPEGFVTRVTPLGMTLGKFPLLPRYGKILALSHQHHLMPFAICLVSALSVREPLVNLTTMANAASADEELGTERLKEMSRLVKIRRLWANQGQSLLLGDLSVLLKAVGSAEFEDMRKEFCEQNGLRHSAMVEIRKMRKQLTDIFNLIYSEGADRNDSPPSISYQLPPPSDSDLRLLRQMVLTGLCENVARRKGDPVKSGAPYQRPDMEEEIFIHPSSVLFRAQPEFVLYTELVEGKEKKLMFNVMAVEPEWLAIYAAAYCSYSSPLETPAPHYDAQRDCVVGTVEVTLGPSAWPLPNAEMPYPADMNYYRLLARDLLEGKVVAKLLDFRRFCLASPDSMLKTWAKGQPRVTGLLTALATSDIRSRADLERRWKEERNFLFPEISAWLPESLQSRLLELWPPL